MHLFGSKEVFLTSCVIPLLMSSVSGPAYALSYKYNWESKRHNGKKDIGICSYEAKKRKGH